MFSPTSTPRPVDAFARGEAGSSRRPARNWRVTVRRAVDLAVAFATLSDDLGPGSRGTESVPHGPVDGPVRHHRRRRLRTSSPARRPGTVAGRPQICLSPVRPHRARHHTSIRR